LLLADKGFEIMPDKSGNKAGRALEPPEPGLSKPIQEHLGQRLRAAYNEVADKPAYLGDPTLPREIEEQLIELETRIRVHDQGTEAVREALATSEPAENVDGETDQDFPKNKTDADSQ
jgi:hypothetical protein